MPVVGHHLIVANDQNEPRGPTASSTEELDRWAAWLLFRRQGGAELPSEVLEWLRGVRDRVLDGARLQPDDVVLDVGCGDGLIGFGALERLSEQGRVIFSDLSRDLLDRCRAAADGAQVLSRCEFVEASADVLTAIADSSVDVVTTRSVLIYVAAKERAFAAFHRVLRPGGRLSIFEPINSFTFPEPPGVFDGHDLRAAGETILAKIKAVFDERAPALAPMMDFDERDLVAIAEKTGFGEIHLTYEVKIGRQVPQDWLQYLNSSGNPLSPTLDEALHQALTRAERERLVACMRPLVEQGRGTLRRAKAFLRAHKIE